MSENDPSTRYVSNESRRIGCGGSCHTAKLVRHPVYEMGRLTINNVLGRAISLFGVR